MTGYRKNEGAVSEVVGTILIVAVTVILAAIVCAFAFGMVGNIHGGKVATSTITRTNSTFVTVIFAGGQNAGSVTAINWTVNGAAPTIYMNGTSYTGGVQNVPARGGILSVGATALLPASSPGKDRVIGVAVFTDGSKQIILDKTI